MINCFKLIITHNIIKNQLYQFKTVVSLLPDMTTTNRTCLMNFAKTHTWWLMQYIDT